MGLFLKEGELLKLQQTGKRPTLKAKDAPKVLGVSQGCEGCSLRQHWPQLLSAKMRMATTKEADILVLGEGPGEQEDLEGIPFVGRSGKFLRDVIPGRKLDRLAWQNTVRCRPPANRNPTPGELHSCSTYLDEDVAALKPKAILGVGGVPLSRWRRPKDAGITDIHGIKFPVQIGGHNCWYYPIMHPSYLLRMGGEDSPAFPIFENDIKRFFRGVDKWPEANTYKLRPSDVTCAYTEAEARAVVGKLAEPIAVDIETPGLRPFRNGGKILTAAFSDGVNTVAFPLNHPEAPNEWGWKLLAEVISSKRWIAHNAAFELTWFWFNMGQDWQPGPFEDTMALARIYYQRHNILSLSNLTFVLLGQDIKELSDIALDRVAEYPLSSVLPYNGLDALATILIYHQLKAKHLDAWQIDKILGAIKSVVRMELLGLPVDLREAADLHTHFDNLRQEAESKARDLYEVRQFELTYQRRFNIGSGEDIGKALEEFGRLTLPKTDKKQIAKTDEAVLEGLNNPLAQQVLTYREAGKLCSTYLEGVLGGTLLGADGNLHPGYTTMFTKTLRLSSENPNCFPPEVEVLTSEGWRNWNALPSDPQLAQYDVVSGEIDFAAPEALIQTYYEGDLIKFRTRGKGTRSPNFEMISSPNHRYFVDQDGRIRWTTAGEGLPAWTHLIQAGQYCAGKVSLRPSQITLISAFQADAYLSPDNGYIDWSFVRERKIARLEEALKAEAVTFTKRPSHKNQTTFYVARRNVPEWLLDKRHYGKWLLELDQATLKLFADELWHWDGGIHGNDFCTGNVEDANWAQIILILTNQASLVSKRRSPGSLFVTKRNRPFLCLIPSTTKEEVPYQGQLYCATMPKGTLIVRYNGKVVICGNCQNYPKRKHREIRRYIVAPKGHVLVPIDYAQIQVRIEAMASFDTVLIEQLLTGYDMHSDWRDKLLRIHPDFMLTVKERSGESTEKKLLKSARDIVKNQFVFASLFGSSAKSAAENLGIPLTVAQELNDTLWQTYRGVKKWHKARRSEYRATGTTTSLTGRKRYQTLMGNEPINYPIQSSEADIVQAVQVELTELSLAECDLYLMPRINVHDDLTFVLPDDSRLEGYIRRIGNIMVKRRFDFLIVPLVVEVSVGYNWADVSEVTKIVGDYYK